MRALRLLAFVTTLMLAWGCGDKNTPDPTPDPNSLFVTFRWDNLANFNLSDVVRVDIVTGRDTVRREVANCRITVPTIPSSVDAVRVFIPGDKGSIWLKADDFGYASETISVTRDLTGIAFVYNRETFELIHNALAGNYLQTDDIDLSGKDWVPIGDSKESNAFEGVYDGGGFSITNIKVDITNANTDIYVGLFGVNAGTLRNILLVGGSVSLRGEVTDNKVRIYCGALCGVNYGGTITSCSNSGDVFMHYNGGFIYCGGVCGGNELSGSITSCHNTGAVSGAGFASGVCGYNESAIIGCSNSGEVNGSGVCEWNTGTITSCHNTSAVIGSGVCGTNYGSITSCYNTGAVSGISYCGGACQINWGPITSCYNIGAVVSASGQGGGICGMNSASITNCYWGGESANLDEAIGTGPRPATATMKFGDGAPESGTGWPEPTMPGWGPDVWASLGGWSNGNPVYPTLK